MEGFSVVTLTIGGNVHLSYANTVYGTNPAGVMAAVDKLGFLILRENSADGVAALKAYYGSRVKVIGIAGNGTIAKAMLLAGADYLEGPNELFTNKNQTVKIGTTTRKRTQTERAAYAITMWEEVYDARQAYTASSGHRVPLLSPSASMGDKADALAVAKLMGALDKQPDIQSHHAYTGNRTVDLYVASLRDSKAIQDALAPGKPRWLTETGSWWDDNAAIRSAASHTPTAPLDAIRLWPLYYDAIEAEGFSVALMYETADEAGTDGYGRKPLQEGRLGVLDLDLSDKPWTPTIRDQAGRRNGLYAPTPMPAPVAPVNSTPWAVAISPDPTARIKAFQAGAGITADGLWGNDSLSAAEQLLATNKSLNDQVTSLQARYADRMTQNQRMAASLDVVSTNLKG